WFNYSGIEDPVFTEYYLQFPDKTPNVILLDTTSDTAMNISIVNELEARGYQETQVSGRYSVYRLFTNE
ncbi:MAG: hypothetical protein K6E41_03385, partial [Solobacterium sp.]|nr:hypothetical protein [Solobacterium sp.]